MGLRGPKPTPNIIKLFNGNPGKRPLNLSDGINPPIAVPSSPKWLSPAANKEWRRISAELSELGLIAKIDMASLATYCQTWGDLVELETAFNAQRRLVSSRTTEDNKDTAMMALYFQKTPTGFLRDSALHKKIVDMRTELDRYVRNFGLNPSARARVQASNHVQPDLFGNQPEEAPSGFSRFASTQK
jgi:P27 family predicted phage terminase small subunit